MIAANVQAAKFLKRHRIPGLYRVHPRPDPDRFAELRLYLTGLGLKVPVMPDGAFYLYVDISSTGLDSETFCWRLIDEYQVAVTPGIDFGSHLADRYVRFAYTTAEADIDLGVSRIGEALRAWSAG